VATRENWKWNGPEVVRTYPSDDVGSAVHCECRYMGSGRPVPHGDPLKMKNARYFGTS
jgi:hypothetical protein